MEKQYLSVLALQLLDMLNMLRTFTLAIQAKSVYSCLYTSYEISSKTNHAINAV